MAVATTRLLTIEEAARELRQSVVTVRRKVAIGEIRGVRLGEHGPLRIPVGELESHLRPVVGRTSADRARVPPARDGSEEAA